MMKHDIVYDEDIHGFKEVYGDVISANLKKVTEGDDDVERCRNKLSI
jgi:hypothetical protein